LTPEAGSCAQAERYCLRTDWSADRDRALVADWVDWMAPFLLTLPRIDDELRGRLEREASKPPFLTDSLWRLFPRVLNPDRLNRVRFEAKPLRASA
jgi:hypothetical protein